VDHFLKEAFGGEQYIEIDEKLLNYLITRDYPGNIRELKQLVNRLVLKYPGKGPLTMGMLPKSELVLLKDIVNEEHNSNLHKGIHKSMLSGIGIREIKEMVGNIAIQIALEQENGNLQRAAQKLGLTDRSLQLWKSKMNGEALTKLEDFNGN
jgi:DNA-binding NtrC family response regulator